MLTEQERADIAAVVRKLQTHPAQWEQGVNGGLKVDNKLPNCVATMLQEQSFNSSARRAVQRYLEAKYNWERTVESWNDQPGRTVEQIVGLLIEVLQEDEA